MEGLSGLTLAIEPYTAGHAGWAGLIANSTAVSLYHRPEWIEILARCYRLAISVASVYRGGELVAACALARTANPFAKRFVALPFSDVAQPLVMPGESLDALPTLLAEQGARGATYELRGYAAAPPWTTVNCFQEWTVSLNRPLAAMQRELDSNFRRNLKQASARKVAIEHGSSLDLLRRFYAMQVATRRRLGLPPQPWKFFRCVYDTFAPSGELEVWLARDGGADEAGAVFLRSGDTVYFKWSARRGTSQPAPPGVNHLLVWKAVEHFAGQANFLDLGRTDVRNEGLNRFKRGLGGNARPLPYAFYPELHGEPSSEVFEGRRKVLADVWRRLPLPVTRVLGGAIYRFLG